jgi:GH15 family glucan-1,4-alpha-glucosidase
MTPREEQGPAPAPKAAPTPQRVRAAQDAPAGQEASAAHEAPAAHRTPAPPETLRIEDYALIGDGETAALVGINGSIDWLCLPRFDSPSCFGAILGTKDNGRWRIAPCEEDVHVRRHYITDTLILETEYTTTSGVATVIDFMPRRGENSDLVRMVIGKEGCVEFDAELVLRFGYGVSVPWVTHMEDGRTRAIAGPDMVVLSSDVDVHGEDLTTVARFSVNAGESISFVLTWGQSHLEPPESIDPQAALEDTQKYWRSWVADCCYEGEWRDAVIRSLITLKALIYHPTGGIVAAPTTSLPEWIGAPRNWDYRYCWLRDATFTLLALMDAGYFDEAAAWREWLMRAAAGSPEQVQIMYGIAGERHLFEWELPWLRGYQESVPVRIGNAAHAQLQLDVFGEVMDALHQARVGGVGDSAGGWALQKSLVRHVEKIWQKPDYGLWEVRGDPQHFTHSKVMCWVAVDRALQSAEQFGLDDAPLDEWRLLRDTIHDNVCWNAFNDELGSFVQAYGSTQIDASLLLLPLVGFLPPDDERIRGTVRAVEEHLLVDGFVLRYNTEYTDDGLPHGEGAFLACSFWLVDNYAMAGRIDDARNLFERLLSLCNSLGLLAEEYDPRAGRMLGNFPQAFSHVGLVNAALNITHASKAGQKKNAPAAQRGVTSNQTGPARSGE